MASTSGNSDGSDYGFAEFTEGVLGKKKKMQTGIALAVWSLLLVFLLINIMEAIETETIDCAVITAYPDCDVCDVSKPTKMQELDCNECEGCLDHGFGKALFGTYMSSLGITTYVLFSISTVVFVWLRFTS